MINIVAESMVGIPAGEIVLREYACRAGSGDVRDGELDEIAWYRDKEPPDLQHRRRRLPPRPVALVS